MERVTEGERKRERKRDKDRDTQREGVSHWLAWNLLGRIVKWAGS